MKRLSLIVIFFTLLFSNDFVYASSWQLAMLTEEQQNLILQLSDRNESVTRSSLLLEAVSALYGDDIQYYSNPFTSVPRDARSAVGLARFVGALPQSWGRSEYWNATVSRCQALEVIFALGKVQPIHGKAEQFRDVRIRSQQQLVQQALEWNVLQPINKTTFGCSRAITAAQLNMALQQVATHLKVPLTPPAAGPPKTPSRTPARPTRGRTTIPTITIEMGKVDTGSRRIGRTQQSLPNNDLLETVWGMISSRFLYHDRIDEKEMTYAMAEKMMELLKDDYSVFMRPSNAESFRIQLHGELTGIGAQVQTNAGGGVTVVSPLPKSPAMQAGVKPGDVITHVNGESILELNLSDAVEKIRGPVGSTANLTIKRNGGTITIAVIRDKIIIPELDVSTQDNVLVVKIIQFGDRTRNDLMKMIEEGLTKNPSGIVLDLRNDPGGLLEAAIDVASYFLPPDSVVTKIREQTSEREERSHARLYIVPENMPVVVLVNDGSASASEIVAGALQDHKRATILGTKTFGKGTVQEVVSLLTGESVKITIAEWLTPNGHSIQGNGVTPDVILSQEQVNTRDEQLLEAIRLLKNTARRR